MMPIQLGSKRERDSTTEAVAMTTFQVGSKGPEVTQLQLKLANISFYAGPVDGVFGGGTQAAVRAFQSSNNLAADGIVSLATWQKLFDGAPPPSPAILGESLAFRCLALTGAFETNTPPPECFAGLSGDFDGQGISFGALQWCLGQDSLQPLLVQMNDSHSEILRANFGSHYPEFAAMLGSTSDQQLAWARSIQTPRGDLSEPWRGMLKTLGRRQEFIDIEIGAASRLFRSALDLCRSFNLGSQRAVALMFDIKVQNGGISDLVSAQIHGDIARLTTPASGPALEQPALEIVANRRADAANPRWIEDVRRRKLAIASGQGLVHGCAYDLAAQYGIALVAAEELALATS